MVDYCTSAQIFSFLQLGTTSGYSGLTDFSASTVPTKVQVEEMIVESEDEINQQTMNSWKSETVTKEYHTIDRPTIRYEGTKIFMGNRNITTLSSPTDKLEVWTGTSGNDGWEDYLITRTEGRNKDYWINNQDGILFIKTYPRYFRRTFDVRLTYRFTELTVKKDIEKACIRLTAISLASSDDKSILFPEGSSNIPLPDKATKWQEQADKIINSNRELKVAII